MTTIRLPAHIEAEADLYGEQFARFIKGLRPGAPGFNKAKSQARLRYIRDFIKHTQIGR